MSSATVSAPDEQPPFFQVGIPKLVVMSVFSWGFYELYWSYKQWDAFRRRTGEPLNAVLRSVFAMPLFLFPLLRTAARTMAAKGTIRLRYPVLLATGFVVLSLVAFIPSWFSLLSVFAVVPLAVAQARMNEFNREAGLDVR